MERKKKIVDLMEEAVANIGFLRKQETIDTINEIAELLIAALRNNHRIYFCGNGGSAADCQHLAAEFVGRFQKERAGLPAVSLTTDTSILTAVGNDYGFKYIFSRQLEALAQKGDVLFLLSTSGKSDNVITAALESRRNGLKVIALTGGDGGELIKFSDLSLIAPGKNTARIQEAHIMVGHILVEITEEELNGKSQN